MSYLKLAVAFALLQWLVNFFGGFLRPFAERGQTERKARRR